MGVFIKMYLTVKFQLGIYIRYERQVSFYQIKKLFILLVFYMTTVIINNRI